MQRETTARCLVLIKIPTYKRPKWQLGLSVAIKGHIMPIFSSSFLLLSSIRVALYTSKNLYLSHIACFAALQFHVCLMIAIITSVSLSPPLSTKPNFVLIRRRSSSRNACEHHFITVIHQCFLLFISFVSNKSADLDYHIEYLILL